MGSMCVQPVFAGTDAHLYGDFGFDGMNHFLGDDRFNDLHLIYQCVKNQLIMHLQGHPAFKFMLFEFFMYADHGYLDHICGRALHRSVNGISLCKTTHSEIL